MQIHRRESVLQQHLRLRACSKQNLHFKRVDRQRFSSQKRRVRPSAQRLGRRPALRAMQRFTLDAGRPNRASPRLRIAIAPVACRACIACRQNAKKKQISRLPRQLPRAEAAWTVCLLQRRPWLVKKKFDVTQATNVESDAAKIATRSALSPLPSPVEASGVRGPVAVGETHIG